MINSTTTTLSLSNLKPNFKPYIPRDDNEPQIKFIEQLLGSHFFNSIFKMCASFEHTQFKRFCFITIKEVII